MFQDERVMELVELAAVKGFDLPMPVEQIIALEAKGHIVDLRTGEIVSDGASQRYALSTAGEVELFIAESLGGVDL